MSSSRYELIANEAHSAELHGYEFIYDESEWYNCFII